MADQVLQCQFHEWYPKFRRHTFESVIITLPEEFVSYLLQDGVYATQSGIDEKGVPQSEYDVASDSDDWEEGDAKIAPEFEELEQKVRETITQLGSSAFPKLNWSCPRDAAWINFNQSLKCSTPNDVFLLLKSSDFISHDLTLAFEHCDPPAPTRPELFTLVLRQWWDIPDAEVFRCFVKNDTLIGICQRECTAFFPFLATSRQQLRELVAVFHADCVRGEFPATTYVFDVWVKFDSERVMIVDFNPWGHATDALLFSWEELNTGMDVVDLPVVRIVESQGGMVPSVAMYSRMPKDLMYFQELALANNEDLEDFAKRFQNNTLPGLDVEDNQEDDARED